ncbi:MAG: hypothetical protein H0X42_04495 [Solirubrobacterales bacterium]|nr:hypothetical protein [Solirubrobacterales bacterium]
MIATVLGAALLLSVGAWFLGGLAPRLGGALLMLAGLAMAVGYGRLVGLAAILLGFGLWLAGHRPYAPRHGATKSAVADRLLNSPRRQL